MKKGTIFNCGNCVHTEYCNTRNVLTSKTRHYCRLTDENPPYIIIERFDETGKSKIIIFLKTDNETTQIQ
jgi:hypothetical protein